MLNDWGEGGYLMWRFPELDFVMNGYGDIYTDDELARNFRMDGDRPRLGGRRQGHRRARTRCSGRARELAYGLQTLEGWRCCTAATTLVLLEAPTTGRRPTRRPGPDMAEPRRSGVRRRGPQA